MQVTFFTNTSDNAYCGKNITPLYTTNCDVVTPCTLLEPVFTVNDTPQLANANYCFIPQFNRFYYVTITYESHGICTVNCSVDVLQSFENYIRGLYTLIERQEFVFSPYILDGELLTRVDRKLTYKKLGSIGNPSGAYIALTVTGGEGVSDV